MVYRRGGVGKSYSTAPPGIGPRHGWEGRGRTFIWGFKGPGPAVRRPPSAPAILAGGRNPVKDGAGSPLVRPDHGLLDHLEVANDEAVVEDDRGVPFQLLVVRHRKDLHLGDPHPGLLPFPR